MQPQKVLLLRCCSGSCRCSSGHGPHQVPFGRVALQVPKGMPHQAPNPQPFPKVSSFCVAHLGCQRETLLLHGEDVLPAPSEPNIRTHLMREDLSNPLKLADKADEIQQSSSARTVNAVSTTSPSPPDLDDFVNALRPAPCSSHPQLCPPVPPPTSAGIIANRVINIAELCVPGFKETS